MRLSITDDGRGLPAPLVEGVGVAAIRERAAELGGAVEFSTGAGTTIAAAIPLRPPTTTP